MIKAIFEDGHILVLDKPAGLIVDRSNTQTEDALEDILKQKFQIKLDRGGIVHRLDKDTSGVILVAKTQQALENLQAQFKERKTKKEYLALVHGFVETGGKVERNIGRNPQKREKFTVMEDEGKEAVTEYEPMENVQCTMYDLQKIFSEFNKIQMRKLEKQGYGNFTLVKCYPKTGRTHQIRVHLKHIGHSVVGDSKYAGRKVYRLDHRWCPRQFLHAARIEFDHPVTSERIIFTSPLADDLKKVLWETFSYSWL